MNIVTTYLMVGGPFDGRSTKLAETNPLTDTVICQQEMSESWCEEMALYLLGVGKKPITEPEQYIYRLEDNKLIYKGITCSKRFGIGCG